MSVVLSIEDVGPCRKQLKVEVPAPAVEAETRRVVDEFRRRARLPGFRKGKAPSHLIRQKFRQDIEKEVVDRLLPRFWRQAQAEKELEPLLPPSVDEVDLRPGASLTFVASVEIRPEIELGELEDFELPEMDTEPTDGDMEKALEEMRRAVAEWVEVDRAAAQGDLVTAELVQLQPRSEERPEPKSVSFEVGDPQVWEEISLAVTGRSSGQSGEFERREGEGAEAETRRYRVSVKGVQERELPALDDELAARIGEFEDVSGLKDDVRKRLRRAKIVDRRQKRERALLDQLRERHPIELPQGVVDHEIEVMLRDYARNLAGSGVDLERATIDWQALAEQIRPQARQRVHARLLLDAVADKLGLEVSEDEFERTLATIARAKRQTTAALRQELDRSDKLAALREEMRRERVLRELLGEEPTGMAEAAGSSLAVTENRPVTED